MSIKGDADSTKVSGTASLRFRPGSPAGVVIQLCLFLCGLCLLALFFPGRLDSADAVQPELRHYVAKVASFLSSNEQPEIVILGSSLMLYPATLCDLEMEGKKPVDNNWYAAIFMPEYQYAKYFEKLLNQQCHLNYNITNLAVASSLMSDHCQLLEAIVAAGKTPKLVICGVAPRDFIDNNQPDLNLTPVHKLLSDIRPELFQSGEPKGFAVALNSKWLQVRRATSCLRSTINNCFCLLANRPTNDNASKMVKGVLHLPASKDKDLAIYNKVYNPVSEKRFQQQSVYLERLLYDARAKHIAVLLVSMPITADNANLLPPPALERYTQTVKNTAAKYRVKFLDLQRSPDFGAADFIDSCHLNATGGAKFYFQLVKAISDSGLLQAK
jgi:hypothetical protein